MAKATTFLLKSNPLLLSQQRVHYFRGNLGCMKSAKFSTSSRIESVGMKSFTSTPRSCSASKNKYVVPVFPFNFEWPSITSEPEENSSETEMLNTFFNALKLLKVSAVLTVQSLVVVMMMMYGCDSALARSGGVMGGHSLSSGSTSRSSSSSSTSRYSSLSSPTSRSSSSSSSSSSSRPSYSSSSSSYGQPSYSSSSSRKPSYSSTAKPSFSSSTTKSSSSDSFSWLSLQPSSESPSSEEEKSYSDDKESSETVASQSMAL